MKRLSWIITIPVTLVVVVLALANREVATLRLWPLDLSVEMPMFLVILLALLAGFLIGAAIMWLSGGRYRRRARKAYFTITDLERDVRDLQRRLSRADAKSKDASSGPALKPLGGGSQRPAA